MTILESACRCGEPILVQLDSPIGARADRKRPHYTDSAPGATVFRCRACHGWLGDTCPAATFSTPTEPGR